MTEDEARQAARSVAVLMGIKPKISPKAGQNFIGVDSHQPALNVRSA